MYNGVDVMGGEKIKKKIVCLFVRMQTSKVAF